MKKLKNGKIWVRSSIVALVCFVLGCALHFAGFFTYFENKTYDLRMISASKYKYPCDDIVFVKVDQESIEWAQQNYGWGWPWPREAYAHIIDFFSAGNAASVAFDILYSEPSIYGEADDLELARAEADSGITIQTLNVREEGDEKIVQLPLPVIRDNAAILGNITSSMDSDDIIRRGRLEYELNGNLYPTLGTAPLFLNGEVPDFDSLPRLKDGTVLLRYQRSLDDYLPYSAKYIFEAYDAWKAGEEFECVPEDFEDMYVYTAYYGPGLYDICSTPVSQVFPGVGVHITTLDNYLTDNFIRKTSEAFSCLLIFIFAFLASVVVTLAYIRSSITKTTVIMVVGFIGGTLIAVGLPYIVFLHNIWMLMVAPVFVFVISFLVNVGLSLTTEGKQKRFIKSAFNQCLSKDVVNQIMNDPSSFTLGGKKFQMSALFTDIEKFSSFSELVSATELGALLNYYLTKMSDIIIEERGTIDKYEGDAIVALVGAPVEMEDHAKRACSIAVRMKKAELEMNKEIIQTATAPKSPKMDDDLYKAMRILVANNKKLFTRVGINSGEMIAGYFGSENKKNYTMMGNNVNLASRLEGVNKQYHTNGIIISEATKNLIGDEFLVRSLDRVMVVNINTPLRLYELLDFKADATEETLSYVEKWEKFISDFENNDIAAAYKALKELKALKADDMVADYYLNLFEKYFNKGKYPTESDNEGVAYNPETKVFKILQK